MSRSFLNLQNISFSYDSSTKPIFQHLSCQFETGWTGIIGANGCGKSTLLQLVTGLLEPSQGVFNAPSKAIYCEQRTDYMPGDFSDFLERYDAISLRLKSELNIEDEWINRWETLSHGERKRVQITIALSKEPEILAIDEPSNHLDNKARKYILQALQLYRGIGLLVSHDRELLDTLCTHTLFIDPRAIMLRKGNYSTTIQDIKNEQAFLAHQALESKRRVKSLQREINKRVRKAAEADHKKSKRNLAKKDHDAKSKRDLARLTGKDAVEGKALNRLKSQMNRLQNEQSSIAYVKPSPTGIRITDTQSGSRILLFHLPAIKISVGNHFLDVPDLSLHSDETVGLTGSNGAGKSTFLRWLIHYLNFDPEQLINIPQEIHHSEAEHILRSVKSLPKDQTGFLMAIISRLGSDPVRLLETELPSPGELRKLMLAEGIQRNPRLIIMDEPTNHMDLPSIQNIEEALASCHCAKILVSHDQYFLNKLIQTKWEIQEDEYRKYRLFVKSVD